MSLTTGEDWYAWHDSYDEPGSKLARRLEVVRERIRLALDALPPGPVRMISICAGQGRDLTSALTGHPRASDVSGCLVELDPRNAEIASRGVLAAGLTGVTVVLGDASRTDPYAGYVPADLVLACGVFGNVTLDDIQRVPGFLAGMCAPGGVVIWTRNRRPPDQVPRVCGWFEEHGFGRVWVSPAGLPFGVAVHRFDGPPVPFESGRQMFTFLGRTRVTELEHRT